LSNVAITGPTSGYTDTTHTFTGNLTPANPTQPLTPTWTSAPLSGQDTLTATYQWSTPGTYPITLTAENCGGIVTAAHTITIASPPPGCPRPLSDVAITGPTSGYTDTTYAFNSNLTPADATQPVTLTWTPTPLSVQGTLTSTYRWATPGTYPITLTAENCGGIVTATHTITIASPPPGCPRPLSDVAITGPTSGYTDTTYTFTGSLDPPDATQPLTLTWTPAPLSVQGTLTSTHRWATLGTHTVTLRAENCGGVATATHGIAITPQPASEDDYEPNDGCEQAKFIATTGRPQRHAFEQAGDEDWIAFHATAGFTYTIEARVPPISTADLVLELYDTCPISQAFGDDNPAFNPDIRFNFIAPHSGVYYLRLSNYQTATFGPEAVYHVAVQPLQDLVPSGAVIIVAGKYRSGDDLQANINGVSTRLYDYALAHGCAADQVRFLAADALAKRTDPATLDTLKAAITQWAPARVGPAAALTLYLMDHGHYDKVYLDGEAGEILTPQLLDEWLDALPADVPVNVIIEACYSGSFIDPAWRIGQAGRLVIASTSASAVAYASDDGAVFSDAFLNALSQGLNLWTAFDEGTWAVGQLPSSSLPWRHQVPWLDDDGDGVANAPADGQLATERLFACEVAPPQENWPPHITRAEVRNLTAHQGDVWADAQDDHQELKWMWAVVYPPSWRPATPGEEMVATPKSLSLQAKSIGGYETTYIWPEIGLYRLVIHANDKADLLARPKEIEVSIGGPSLKPGGDLTINIPIGNLDTTVEVPGQAVTATTTFVYTPTTSAPNIAPPEYTFAGRGFKIVAYQWGEPQPGFTFHRPITLTVRYSDDDVDDLDEESLALFYRDGDAWRTDGLIVTRRFTETNEVVVRAGHLTEFGLFGKERGYQVYLPLVMRK
jgi:PKD repeat protein